MELIAALEYSDISYILCYHVRNIGLTCKQIPSRMGGDREHVITGFAGFAVI